MVEDLTGKRFGLWTVIDRATNHGKSQRWNCICDCGTKKEVFGKYLKNGKSTSCGCTHIAVNKYKVNIGKKYDLLTILDCVFDYKTNSTVYVCQCECGTIKKVIPTDLLNGRVKSCGCYKKNSVIKDYTGKKYGKLSINSVVYVDDKGEAMCDCTCDCGTEHYKVRLSALKTGNTTSCGCVHCAPFKGKRFGKLLVIEDIVSENHKNGIAYNEAKCLCDCGNVIIRKRSLLYSGNVKSCGCLSTEIRSLGEIQIQEYLNDSGLNYKTQYSFKDCIGVGKRVLRFDFYIPDKNLLIEYDGKQHYEPVEFFGGMESFEIQKKNDAIKTSYAKNNNIKLLRLPYTLSSDELKDELYKNIA